MRRVKGRAGVNKCGVSSLIPCLFFMFWSLSGGPLHCSYRAFPRRRLPRIHFLRNCSLGINPNVWIIAEFPWASRSAGGPWAPRCGRPVWLGLSALFILSPKCLWSLEISVLGKYVNAPFLLYFPAFRDCLGRNTLGPKVAKTTDLFLLTSRSLKIGIPRSLNGANTSSFWVDFRSTFLGLHLLREALSPQDNVWGSETGLGTHHGGASVQDTPPQTFLPVGLAMIGSYAHILETACRLAN